MPFQGPIVLVSDQANADLAAAVQASGGTPVETSWQRASQTILKSWPAAIVINDPPAQRDPRTIGAIANAIQNMAEPYLPVLARVSGDIGPALPGALPLGMEADSGRVVARLASALRVRSLHATVFRRTATLSAEGGSAPVAEPADPLDDANVLVVGRSYPELTTAVGERLGVIGAMNVETAARYLTARPLNGILIGDGFGPQVVDAFLTALSQDTRFRDLPVAVPKNIPVTADCSALPNYERLDGRPSDIVRWMLPLVRLHAYEERLQRQLAAIEANGMIDPHTGLFTIVAFLRDLNRAIAESGARRTAMSLARFSFLPFVDRRTNLDAARLTSKLVRSVDFACHASDGSILLAFPNTPLRDAHVIARRIANSLKGTMLGAATNNDPIVTLASFKPNDSAESLLYRVSDPVKVAAE